MHIRPVAAVPDLDSETLHRVRGLIFDAAGIVLGDNKASMVKARLSKRLAATGFTEINAYLDFVESVGRLEERDNLVSALTTNVTHFFRENHHFDQLTAIAATAKAQGRQIRLWSAGCSSGPEPYSIAMTLAGAGITASMARILATDIDRKILAKASSGIFDDRDVQSLPSALRNQWLAAEAEGFRISPTLRAMIDFKALNLTGAWPFRTAFDVIFCRNVAIYFDPPTQDRLWSRLIATLRPGGWLFIGHSERIPEALLGDVTYCGQTTYRKTKSSESDGER